MAFTNPFGQDESEETPELPRAGQRLCSTTFKVIAAPCKKHEDCLGNEELGAVCAASRVRPIGPFNDGDDLTDLGQARRYARRLLASKGAEPPLFIVESSTGCHVEMVFW